MLRPAANEAAPLPPRRWRLRCPQCAQTVRRVRRSQLQRTLSSSGVALARYRCKDAAGCGWSGLLSRQRRASSAPQALWTTRVLRGFVPLVLAALAVVAAQWGAARAPVANVAVGTRLFAPGEAFDGEGLPPTHRLHVPVNWAMPAVDAGSRAPPLPAVAATPMGLEVRRFCAWGRPGRMPYRGTVEEALAAAQLPGSVRAQLAADIAAGTAQDRLVIGNEAIRSTTSARQFDAQSVAMTYGRTLCLGTRVNFKPGHTEAASLYEALDPSSGRRYSVMVPDVCGNISVIKAKGEAGTGVLPTEPDPWEADSGDLRITHAAMTDKPHEVPTPGTLALSVLALAGLALFRRRPDRGGGA